MNVHAIRAIYTFEMARTWRTLMQSIVSPVISTSLYFVVFGAAIGSRITAGRRHQLRRLHRARPDHAVAADAEHLQRVVRHLLSEVHRHDLRAAVGAGLVSRDRPGLRRRGGDQVDHPRPDHPGDRRPVRAAADRASVVDGRCSCVLTAVTFSLFGFIIGIWADGFEKLQLVPLLIVTPLTFLGGSFYSIDMLPPFWQNGHPVQSGGLPDQRLSLELLRHRRRERRRQPRHDASCSWRYRWRSSRGSSGPDTG